LRNNPLSRHYIPPKKKSAESWTTKQEMAEELRKMKVKAEIDEAYQGIDFEYDHEAYDEYRDDLHRAGVCDPDDECFLCNDGEGFDAEDEIYGVCPYCGFDAEAAVAYQSKQNDETLTPDQIHDEVEFYLYESHPDFCEGMRNSIKEADYTIDMINSNGIQWSGEIKEKKDKKFRADFEYHYNMSSKYAGSDVLDALRNSSDATKAEAIDWLIDNGFLHSDEQYNAAYVLALGDAIGISDDYESETFEAYNPEQPRDERGRWIADEEEDGQTFIIGDEEWRILPAYGSKITLRELSEAVMETTHNHLDFDTAHQIVNKMLSQHPAGDSQEARTALLLTLEETRMQLEYADEIGWDMDIEIMAGLLRSRGIQPPEELEEAVINRLAFEDEWAAEAITTRFCPICDETGWMVQQHSDSVDWSCSACGHQWHDWRAEETVGYDKPLGESLNWTPYEYGDSKKNKPNKPTPAKDFDMGDTFGRSVLLMSEDDDPEPELKKYMVGVPCLHSYTVGPVEAYDEEDAEDEVRNNWGYWRRTIQGNGDWGGPIWRYWGITIDEPEAYETFESNNYQCISCGLTFAQEDTQDIDGDIVCDDCIYNIYGMDV